MIEARQLVSIIFSYVTGRSPDSRVALADTAPSHAMHSGSLAISLLVYRCGGSAGFDLNDSDRTGFPFHPLDMKNLRAPENVKQCNLGVISCQVRWKSDDYIVMMARLE